ncbi:WXG100 family type VII secretion target [Gordonia soli]|uniref:WXG100 family type VII secretion target n=1 Tax=Gordonia soli NBRC 108243 TaxID=1223545 RepID=M0QLP1_9ACTN|nr:hypothetical protein [Gordonia soli]GAC69329.1 hypothetical protein GS4_23_01260 [Gordonia soli NBRC 108243]
MSGTTSVNFEQLRSGARSLKSASDRIDEIKSELQSALAAEGQAWGTDKPGSTHSVGYDEQTQKNLDGVEDRFEATASYADAIEGAATNFFNREDANSQTYRA